MRIIDRAYKILRIYSYTHEVTYILIYAVRANFSSDGKMPNLRSSFKNDRFTRTHVDGFLDRRTNNYFHDPS